MFPVELIIISNYLEPLGSQPLLFTILSSRKTEPPNLLSSRMCSWAYVLTWLSGLPLPCNNYVERPLPHAGSPPRNIILRSTQVHWIERYSQQLLWLAFSISGLPSCLFSAVRNVCCLWYWLLKFDDVPSSACSWPGCGKAFGFSSTARSFYLNIILDVTLTIHFLIYLEFPLSRRLYAFVHNCIYACIGESLAASHHPHFCYFIIPATIDVERIHKNQPFGNLPYCSTNCLLKPFIFMIRLPLLEAQFEV